MLTIDLVHTLCTEMTKDPTGKCDIPEEYLPDVIGVVPLWFNQTSGTIRDVIQSNYQFSPWCEQSRDLTVHPDGRYCYTGEPDLYPVAKYERGSDTLFQYDYGIIILIENGEFSKPVWGRVD